MSNSIHIEVVAGVSERQLLLELDVPSGATVASAVQASKILKRLPQIDSEEIRFGVWGRVVEPEHPLKDGDRVEIYRPLALDPREARRQLALAGKTMRG